MALALDRNTVFLAMRMALFALLGLLAIFIEIAPLGLNAGAFPSPDLLVCLVACWVLRRPRSAPVLLVFLLGLWRDLLTGTPPGAGTLSLVLMSQALLSWRSWLSIRPFMTEWMVIGVSIAAVLLLQWFLVVVTLGHPPYLAELGLMGLVTMLTYPVVVFVLRWGLGVNWQTPKGLAGRAT